jgi:hypothetical protein
MKALCLAALLLTSPCLRAEDDAQLDLAHARVIGTLVGQRTAVKFKITGQEYNGKTFFYHCAIDAWKWTVGIPEEFIHDDKAIELAFLNGFVDEVFWSDRERKAYRAGFNDGVLAQKEAQPKD